MIETRELPAIVGSAVCEVFLLTLRQHLANLVAAGVRFVVLDLAEVTACPPELVGELATACRALSRGRVG